MPGSTSNCGSGFDTLGLALRIHNRISLTRVREAGGSTGGRAPETARAPAGPAAAFFGKTGLTPFGFSVGLEGEVPPGRGLGSSATVRAGVIAGLNVLAEAGLSARQIVELVAGFEGHPDNAAPAVLGGFCVARTSPTTGSFRDCVRLDVPADLTFVVIAPAAEIRTRESRAALPHTLPFADAAKSINAAAFLVAAFATGNHAKLRHGVADFMHEPHRLPGIRGGRAAIDAGIAAGALTGWLSGSGSSVLCVGDAGRPRLGAGPWRRPSTAPAPPAIGRGRSRRTTRAAWWSDGGRSGGPDQGWAEPTGSRSRGGSSPGQCWMIWAASVRQVSGLKSASFSPGT